jgi:stress-induced morphogen
MIEPAMSRADADRLLAELVRRFGGEGEAEEVNPGQFRFALVSPQFSGVPHLRRQDSIWEVVERVLTREQILGLTLVVAYAPEEIQLVPNP